MYTASKVDRYLRATVHYARDGQTLCGRKVGTLAQRWFVQWPGERIGTVSCARCLARARKESGGK